ncbi:MAG: hypothetical protein M1817_005909 [Caeruleum heppii]|nr:MAG: hypothetical protein M1817_005909 [Caeruleum heppii]
MSSEYAFAPPPVSSNVVSGRRRPAGPQPPALSTTLSAVHRFGSQLAGHTPLSATSLSSPFTGYNPTTYSTTPTLTAAAPSAIAPQPTNVPYNPQHWGGAQPSTHGSGAAYVSTGPQPGHASRFASSSGEASPPPPYSPQRSHHTVLMSSPLETTTSPSQTASPGTNPSQYNTPISAATTISPLGPSVQDITVSSHHMLSQMRSINRNAAHRVPSPLPPPPPPSDRRTQSSSRTTSDHAQLGFSPRSPPTRPTPSSQNPQGGEDAVRRLPAEVLATSGLQPWRASTQPESSNANDTDLGGAIASDLVRAPASRRAASTGGISSSSNISRQPAELSSASQGAWTPGMPLPPPPPGPPPSARSQSMNRSLGSLSRNFSSPVSTDSPSVPHSGQSSRLPPMPPTPADWVEEALVPTGEAPPGRTRRLHLDTTLTAAPRAVDQPRTAAPSTSLRSIESNGLVRSQAVRDSSTKGIRERRSESRTGKGRMAEPFTAVESSNNPWAEIMDPSPVVKPTNLIISPTTSPLSRRRTVTKSTPRSGRALRTPEEARGSTPSMPSAASTNTTSPWQSTPQPALTGGTNTLEPLGIARPTSSRLGSPGQSARLSPHPLPAPPPQPRQFLHRDRSEDGRSSSHPLDMPTIEPKHSSDPIPHADSDSRVDGQSLSSFAQSAIERHRWFAQSEAVAQSDRERLELFTEYIVTESRIRRDRYAGAMDWNGPEILKLTEGLFKPNAKSSTSTATSPSSATSDWNSHRGSLNSAMQGSFTPQESPKAKAEPSWAGVYRPSLSPIPSMSVSEVPDEMSSRGRPSSRWWEASQEGSIYGGGSRGLERSKRESKYMGLPLRDWEASSPADYCAPGPSTQTVEYPPEKVGWHEESTPQSSHPRISTAPPKMDVSRLVTLPPPYPRHHPAVNNNHPDLSSIRTVVRNLNDVTEVIETKKTFALRCDEAEKEAQQRRSQLRRDIQRQIEAGTMTYAAAARLESENEEKAKASIKAQFERFETSVMKPLHACLLQRIDHATSTSDTLRQQLPSLNPLEEGDSKPELLEKLTLLKWLFEGREGLHREVHELLSERNERYKMVVMTPYSSAPDDEAATERLREVERFFAQDARQRRMASEMESRKRLESFMEVVDEHVKRGVESALSTFWDIAPALVDVISRVDVASGVQIVSDAGGSQQSGGAEYAFSQQYLYEVLTHAEKSTYQFIESQINLLCLLHEVKSAVTKQACRVMALERELSDDGASSETGPGDECGEAMSRIQRDEEERLTLDLKEKVSVVEVQWEEAIGAEISRLKQEIKMWLVQRGGWDAVVEDE